MVIAQSEHTYDEQNVQKAVKNELITKNVRFDLVEGMTLYHPHDLEISIKNIPFVFTNFRKHLEKQCDVRGAIVPPQPSTLQVQWFQIQCPIYMISLINLSYQLP